MPVTKSAKKALRTALRRREENILQRSAFKNALKSVRKAIDTGSDKASTLFTEAQSSLDKAAKNNTIHPNKAARLKARLAKKLAAGSTGTTAVKKTTSKAKAATKKKAVAKKK